MAQAAGVAFGRAGAVRGAAPGLGARGGDRGLPAARILDGGRRAPRARRRRVYGPAHASGRQAAGPFRPLERGGGPGRGRGGGGGRPARRRDRAQAGQAPSAPPLHDLDPATGGLAQARHGRDPDDARRPAPLRGRGGGRRGGRADHLHADGRRADGAGRGRRHPGRYPRRLRRGLPAGRAARLPDPRQERAGGARGDPADRSGPPSARGRAPSRPRPGPALRTDLEPRRRQPDGQRRTRPDRRDRRGRGRERGAARRRLRRRVRGLPETLPRGPGRPRRRGRRGGPPAPAAEGRRPAGARGRDAGTALHAAPAPLHRGEPGETAGGARHRPPLHLRRHPAGAPGPGVCAPGEAPFRAGGPRPDRHRLPRQLLRALCPVQLHRRPGGRTRRGRPGQAGLAGRAGAVLGGLQRHRGRDQRPARLRSAGPARQGPRPAFLPRRPRRRVEPGLPALRRRPAQPEARPLRRVHRLLELSRMPVHPPVRRAGRDGGRGRRGRAGGAAPSRKRPGDRPAGEPAQGTLRPLRATRRGRAGEIRQAEARLAAEGPRPGRPRPGGRGRPARPAARGRPAPGIRRADPGRDRPFRPLPEARRGLHLDPRRRGPAGGAEHRAEPRRRPDREQEGRRFGGPDARRVGRQAGHAALRALRPLCAAGQDPRQPAQGRGAGGHHARTRAGADPGEGRTRRRERQGRGDGPQVPGQGRGEGKNRGEGENRDEGENGATAKTGAKATAKPGAKTGAAAPGRAGRTPG